MQLYLMVYCCSTFHLTTPNNLPPLSFVVVVLTVTTEITQFMLTQCFMFVIKCVD